MNKIVINVMSGPTIKIPYSVERSRQMLDTKRAIIDLDKNVFVTAECDNSHKNLFSLFATKESADELALDYICDPFLNFDTIESFFTARSTYMHSSLPKIAHSFSSFYLNNKKNNEKSKLRHIYNAISRFELVDKLSAQKFADDLYWDYQGLAYYLLLSCFDILGGSKDWIKFDDWLTTTKEKYRNERQVVIQNDSKLDGEGFIACVYREYVKGYSIKKSFVQFIEEVLTVYERRFFLALQLKSGMK